MASNSEAKAVNVLLDAADRNSFIPNAFGLYMAQQDPSKVQRAYAGFLSVTQFLADRYDAGRYDDRNHDACFAAHLIREALLVEYGCFPPRFDSI